MRQRCNNPNDSSYKFYGLKGIKVCEQWLKFENFLADMGEVLEGYSIDRINPKGNYEPLNCRWLKRKEQNRNKSTNRLITFNGKTLCVGEWAEEIGVIPSVLQYRLNANWPVEEVLTTKATEGRSI